MIFSTGPLSEVGRVIKTHGYEGNLRFEIFNGIEIDIKEPVFMMFDHKPVPFFITQISKNNPHIIALTDVSTLERAQMFLNKSVYLPVLEADEDEEEDTLIGYTIKDTKLGILGVVKEVIDNSAQSLLLVEYNEKEVLIPFVDAIVENIDDEKKQISVVLPEGLIEMDD